MNSTRKAGRVVAISLMAFGFLANPLAAQKPSPRVGVMAGVTFNTVSGEDADDFKSLTSFLAGGFAELPLSNLISLQGEALYRVKGFSAEDGNDKLSLKASYFQVPVLLRINIPTNSDGATRIRPHVYAGPAFGFKASCKITGTDGGSPVNEPCSEFDAEIKSTEMSAVFGAGLDINDFTLGVRYDLGLSQVSPDANEDSKLRSLAIYLGYGFQLRK